ncbi:MAG: TaqI-like C-terminal specificity domain-containing protein [Ginsengibacter sp.]
MYSKEEAYSKIAELVERFSFQIDSYKKVEYNEAQTRQDFINPFFKALGWDIDNSQGNAEAYREVIHEDKLKIGSATKAPDYSFRLPGGKRLFFVEAKKPSVLVKHDIVPAYQVRRYGWSAKMPVSLITDFEEFAVYDCSKKPNTSDKASTARIKYFTYNQYLDEFDFIWNTFSKSSVLKGSFDKFIVSDKNKKGTATVDKEFLASLDEWRKLLAQNIALRNMQLTEDELNFVVQQTIDRIIFLRIAEDRGVETYGELKTIFTKSKEEGIYFKGLFTLFKEADSKYNSGLFDFKKDALSKNIAIDNKIIKTIIDALYYPQSPYEFSVLGVEILGSAYEQFLGKQIKLNAGHKAIIEEKPEVRKAGGVYYTPQYIVEYIVQNTVGKLTESKTPEHVAKLKIVDPACGSGSFLIGAYEYLLSWHLDYYKPEFLKLSATAADNTINTKVREAAIKDRNKLPLTPDGNLTTTLKKQILLNNIYGVDIDTQAVEVTKLSLLLKCMEGETGSSINAVMRFGERVLPTLDENIKNGNSLIDVDFYDAQFDFGEEKKIKPFNWQQAFPKVFAQKGFDAVIGNPPYVRQEILGDIKPYLQKKYKVYHGMADLYSYFIEKGIELLNGKGLFGIIVANKWMRANYGEPLRKWLKQKGILEIIDFGDLPVFQGATTYPCILIADACKEENISFNATAMSTLDFENLNSYVEQHKKIVNKNSLNDEGWHLGSEAEQSLLMKLQQAGVSLGEYVKGKIYYGIKTGLNEAFVIDEATKNRLIAEDERSEEIIKPLLAGRDVKRYEVLNSDKYLIFTKRGIDIDNYPAIKNYLYQFKEALSPKPKGWNGKIWKGRKPGSYLWYEIQDAVDYYKEFEKAKISIPDIALRMQATYDNQKFYLVNTAYIIPFDDKYLLAILNSNLIQFLYSKISSSIRGGYFRFIRQYLEILPIKDDKNFRVELIHLAESILQLNKEKQQTTLPDKLDHINTRIKYTDDKINKLVYELYELNEEEIGIVERII